MRRTLARASTAALGVAALLVVTACGQAPSTSSPATPSRCPTTGHVLRVADAAALSGALRDAVAGDTVVLADGIYAGTFEAVRSSASSGAVVVCGGAGAILQGGSSGYTLHLVGVDGWTVEGLTVSGGDKGIVLDSAQRTTLRHVHVTGTGEEGIHLRSGSRDDVVDGVVVDHTGLRIPTYGEGVYVGSAYRHWCEFSQCSADASDDAVIRDSHFGPGITAEAIDVKEGTTGGLVDSNTFDGTGMSAADSWVDVKGDDWTVTRNVGRSSLKDGVQIHVVVPGWGTGDRVDSNELTVDASGYGVRVAAQSSGTVVACSNVVRGAGSGLSNVPCTPTGSRP